MNLKQQFVLNLHFHIIMRIQRLYWMHITFSNCILKTITVIVYLRKLPHFCCIMCESVLSCRRSSGSMTFVIFLNCLQLRSLALPFTVLEWTLPAAPRPSQNASKQSSTSKERSGGALLTHQQSHITGNVIGSILDSYNIIYLSFLLWLHFCNIIVR